MPGERAFKLSKFLCDYKAIRQIVILRIDLKAQWLEKVLVVMVIINEVRDFGINYNLFYHSFAKKVLWSKHIVLFWKTSMILKKGNRGDQKWEWKNSTISFHFV